MERGELRFFSEFSDSIRFHDSHDYRRNWAPHSRITYHYLFSVDVTELNIYSGSPLYGHPLNTDTRILQTVSFVPTKSSYIFTKIYPLNTDTRILRTVSFVPTKGSYIFTKIYPLNTDTRILRTVSFVPTKGSYIFTKIYPLNTDTG